MSKYDLLNNVNWLREQYLDKGLSTNQIGNIVGVKAANSVRQHLIKYGIPIRSISEGLTHNRIDDGFKLRENVLVGCLLGDGGLAKWNKKSDGSIPSFYKKNKYYNHIKFVGELLMGQQWKQHYKEEYRLINGKNLLYHRIDTLTHVELLPIYKKWYPASNDFKKMIPDDVELDPVVLLHWFLDDGSTSFRKDRDSIVATLCTESFSLSDQECVRDKLNFKYGLDLILKKCNFGTGWRIGIKSSKLQDFFNLIGPCPIPDLIYKWKLPK